MAPFSSAFRGSLLLLPTVFFLRQGSRKEGRDLRQKHRYLLLILLVYWIFLSSDTLCDRCRTLEYAQISQQTNTSPIVVGVGLPTAPLIEEDPDALFSSKIGVS